MKSLLIIAISLVLSACGASNGSGGTVATGGESITPPTQSTFTLTGQAQKGPLIFGSRIWVSELDTSLNPNGKIYLAQTKDDLGNFIISSTIGSNLVELVGTGYYMDELTGSLSTSPVTLNGIADLSVDNTPTINILTTLQAPRLKNLILQGKNYTQAAAQSQTEVLSAFGIDSTKIASLQALYAMQVNGTSDQDSALLAASAVLSKMSSTAATTNGSSQAAEMSYFLSRIASDISNSGSLTTNTIVSARNTAAMQLDLTAVRTNIETYYANRGLSIVAPKFEEWVDKDGSGILPRRLVPVSGLTFTDTTNVEHSQVVTSNVVAIGGLGAGVIAAVATNANTTIIKNGTTTSSTSTTVQDGDTIALRRTSMGFGLSTSSTISVGSSSAVWQITTRVPQIAYDSQGGASVPQDASNVYFAVPIKIMNDFTVHYAGIGIGSIPTSLSIYTDNAGIPGIPLATTNTFGSYFSAALTRTDGSAFSNYSSPQAFLGTAGIALSANTAYWIVARYVAVTTPAMNNALGVNNTGLLRKMSSDGTSWVNWVGSNGNRDNENPAALPGHFLAN